MVTKARQALTHVWQPFNRLHYAQIRWQCTKIHKERQTDYSLVLTFISHAKKNLVVNADHGSRTIIVLTPNDKQLVFKMVGNPSYTNLRIVWRDGADIGSGLNSILLPPEDNLNLGSYQKDYKIFKRTQGVTSEESRDILVASIRHNTKCKLIRGLLTKWCI